MPHRADGYIFENGSYRHGERMRPAVIAPNGGVMTNVLDFAAWDIALTAGRLLKPETVQAIATPVRLNDGRTVSHGLGWFMDRFNGHRFGAHWGTTVTGHSAVVRRYVDDRVTVIVLANAGHETGQAVDTISKCVANMYVPGTVVQGLAPQRDPAPADSGRLKTLLEAVAAGRDDPGAPGLGTRLPQPVRDRFGAALRTATTFEYLGEEHVDCLAFQSGSCTRAESLVSGRHAGGIPVFHASAFVHFNATRRVDRRRVGGWVALADATARSRRGEGTSWSSCPRRETCAGPGSALRDRRSPPASRPVCARAAPA